MKHFSPSRLASMLLLLISCFASSHAQTFTVDGISYSVDWNTEIKVIAGEELYSGDIVIPETVTVDDVTYTVTKISDKAFDGCKELTSISLPNTLTKILNYAFRSCSSLVEITIPESVTSIGWNAFDKCTDLETVTLPDGLTKLESNVFDFCSSLEEINIPAKLTTIGSCCFRNCSSLSSIVIPESVTNIASKAFYYCSALKGKFNINAKTIGDQAFYYTGITGVTFGDKVESIGKQAFYGTKISNLVLGKNVTKLGSEAFNSPYYITLNEVITDLNGAFNKCSSIYTITVNTPTPPTGISITDPQTLSTAQIRLNGEWTQAYEQADGWKDFFYIVAEWDKTKATLTDGIYYNFTSESTAEVVAGENAYSGSITIPATIEHEGTIYNVTAIRSEAFKSSSVSSVSLPEGLNEIGVAAFNGCSSLYSIAFPNSLTRLNPHAFSASGIQEITWGTGLSALEGLTFAKYSSGYNDYAITIPATITSLGYRDFAGWLPRSGGTVTLESATPPATDTALFEDIYSETYYDRATLNIPQGSRDAYEAVSPWNLFETINEMETTGIESIGSDNAENITVNGNTINVTEATGIAIHDTSGKLIYAGKNASVTVPAGIYIVNDGNASHKVIIRN